MAPDLVLQAGPFSTLTTGLRSHKLTMMLSHPKSPKSKDDDDEVNDVGEEHECVDISGSPTLSTEDAPKETSGWTVNSLNPGGKRSNDGFRADQSCCDQVAPNLGNVHESSEVDVNIFPAYPETKTCLIFCAAATSLRPPGSLFVPFLLFLVGSLVASVVSAGGATAGDNQISDEDLTTLTAVAPPFPSTNRCCALLWDAAFSCESG